MNEILNNLWAAGICFILLAFVMKLFFSRNGLGANFYIENANKLEKTDQDEYADKLLKMSNNYTIRERLYFWPLLTIGLIMIIVSVISKI